MKPIIWIPALVICGLAIFSFLPNSVLSKTCDPLPAMEGLTKQDLYKAMHSRIQQCPAETFEALKESENPELLMFVANQRNFRAGEARPYYFEFAVAVHNKYSTQCAQNPDGHLGWVCIRFKQLNEMAHREPK